MLELKCTALLRSICPRHRFLLVSVNYILLPILNVSCIIHHSTDFYYISTVITNILGSWNAPYAYYAYSLYKLWMNDLFLLQRKIMSQHLARGLATVSVTHYHPLMLPSHVTKQPLLYSTLLTSHRNYSNEKQDNGECSIRNVFLITLSPF